MGYSVDLREKAIEYYNECKNATKTCNIFKIARSTLYSWVNLHTEQGSLGPKVRTEYKTKIDYKKLKELVKARPDAFLREYAEHFGVTIEAMRKALEKLKITRKKKLKPSRKPILKNKKYLKNT